MTTTETHQNNISTGFAEVWRGDRILGTVERIDWPHEVNGHMEMGQLWQARTPCHFFGPVSPTFSTQSDAVAYLTGEC